LPRCHSSCRTQRLAAEAFIAILDIGPLVGIGANANAILTLLAPLIFIVAHGYIAPGWRNFIAFSPITVALSFTSEAIGVATGLVFGAYHYTDLCATEMHGLMEGAVRSGESAADQVLNAVA
jgi:uncharacterized membrane protein